MVIPLSLNGRSDPFIIHGPTPSRKSEKRSRRFLISLISFLFVTIVATIFFVINGTTDVFSFTVHGRNAGKGDDGSYPTNTGGADEGDSLAGGAEDRPSQMPSGVLTTTLPQPPSNIEGTCAPSNMPGSFSACLAACRPAACCYPGGDARIAMCLADDAGCRAYRPYCDVIHDPWLGATQGSIRPPPLEGVNGEKSLETLCGAGKEFLTVIESWERKGYVEDVGGALSGGRVGEVESTTRMRHRAHVGGDSESLSTTAGTERLTSKLREMALPGFHRDRRLQTEGDEPIVPPDCFHSCLPSRCCFAPPVSDSLISESPDGMHTDTKTDEYVVTNCEADNAMYCRTYSEQYFEEVFEYLNRGELENKYTSYTLDDPSPPHTNTLNPSHLSSSRPSPAPTVPRAPAADIDAACSGTENNDAISRGVPSARAACQDACSDGLCCFDVLGDLTSDWSASCFDTNERICAGYSSCLSLMLRPDDVSSSWPPLQGGEQGIGGSGMLAPPLPTQNLASLCSFDAITSPSGLIQCYKACRPGSCCGARKTNGTDLTCLDVFEDICVLYGPCQGMADAYGGDGGPADPLPPEPPHNLPLLCSYGSLLANLESGGLESSECHSICRDGGCCLDGTCPDVSSTPAVRAVRSSGADSVQRCALYEPCHNLEEPPPPPAYIEELCRGEDAATMSDECRTSCAVASCCFASSPPAVTLALWPSLSSGSGSTSEELCFAIFDESCRKYAPHCAPPTQLEGPTTDLPAPPSDLDSSCSAGGGGSCEVACVVASCCFDIRPKENCFATNEDVCGQYASCAALHDTGSEVFE